MSNLLEENFLNEIRIGWAKYLEGIYGRLLSPGRPLVTSPCSHPPTHSHASCLLSNSRSQAYFALLATDATYLLMRFQLMQPLSWLIKVVMANRSRPCAGFPTWLRSRLLPLLNVRNDPDLRTLHASPEPPVSGAQTFGIRFIANQFTMSTRAVKG